VISLLGAVACLGTLEVGARLYTRNNDAGILAHRPALSLYAGIAHPEEVFSSLNLDCVEWAPYEHWRIRPNLRSRFYRTNALGFRGRETTLDKPAGRFRIVVLGGSTAWGVGATADERTVPGRLEAILREQHPRRDIEVINAGQPGFGSTQELIYFHRLVTRLHADVVLLFDAYNDVYADLLNPEPDWPQNALLLKSRYDGSFELHPLRRELAALLRQSRFLEFAARRIRPATAYGSGPNIAPEATAANYIANVEAIARLAAPGRVWVAPAPVLATIRKPLSPEERQMLVEKERDVPNYAARVRSAYRAIGDRVRASSLPFVDLDDALGSEPKLRFADECHFGDEAADRFARQIAATWKDVIQ